jgi:hypothetical protein
MKPKGKVMPKHKFRIGQDVAYMPGKLQRPATSSTYKVTRLLPTEGPECQYRIKSSSEPFERTASERQLSRREIV